MASAPSTVVQVLLAPWAHDGEALDVRLGEWSSLAATSLERGGRALAVGDAVVRHGFDRYDLTAAADHGAYARIEGIVERIDLVAGADASGAMRATPATSTLAATRDRGAGALVTFAAGSTVDPIALTSETVRLGHRLGALGARLAGTTIVIASWQVDEEGFDVRPGDRLSWPVTPRKPDDWISLPQSRAIDLVADTYLQRGASAATDRGDGTVEPAHAEPEVVRVDGIGGRVEALRHVGAREVVREVSGTRTAHLDLGSFLVHLEPGAVLTPSNAADERYETSR